MEKYILQELSEAERKQTLIDNADGVEEMGYTKPMTQKQIDDTKQLLAEETIQLKDVEAEKKAVDADYNSQIKTHKQNISEAAEMLKAKGKYVIGKVYKMVDLDAKRVGLYSPEEMLVTERPAEPNELQPGLFAKTLNLKPTGTDDAAPGNNQDK